LITISCGEMTRIPRFFIIITLFLMIFVHQGINLAWAQSGDIIKSVEVRGNSRVSDSTILYYINTEIGKPLSGNQIRSDIEEIYSLGQFKDIRVQTEEGAGGLKVIFIVEEIASIGSVRLVGNDQIETDDIMEAIGIRRGASFRDHLVQESVDEIIKMYHDKGYFFVKVDVKTRLNSDSQVDAVIRISEGEVVSIEKIRFSGNKNIPDKDLIDKMETKSKSWFAWLDDSGIYKKDVLKIDLLRIESYYHDEGFVKIRVMDPEIDISKKTKKIFITIPVEEGKQYSIGKIILEGDDTFTSKELRQAIKSKEGQIYNLSQIREDVIAITELYSEKGFAYADVSPLTKLDDNKKRVDLDFKADKGRKVYVGQIDIAGNTKTLDNVIRREFRLKEGELFNGKKLKRTKQRINNLGFFEDVRIDTKPGKEPDKLDVETTVTEKPTGSFTIGAGFSSVENLIFSASVSQDNIFGRGQKLAFSTELSSRRNNFNVSFTDPRLLDSDVTAGIDLFNRKSNFFSFESRNRGGGIRLGKAIGEYDWLGINYRVENVRTSEIEEDQETNFLFNGERTTSRIGPTFIRDTRDNFLNPTKGWRHVVKLELGGLGGLKFYRTNYEITYYRKIVGKLVGAAHGEFNYADGYSGDVLPIFERYFMGGPNSLRGYTIRDIGPKDSTGDPVGGTQSLLFNLELQYPITKSFRAFTFYDRGNVFGDGTDITTTREDINLADMRSSIGAGIRFISPFGPIGFAYGYKLDRDEQDQNKVGEFHFTAGSGF
jgi:outer membrane protein insertion porin family